MFHLSKTIPLLATSVLLTACGGGDESGGAVDSPSPSSLTFNVSSAQSLAMTSSLNSASNTIRTSSYGDTYSITYNDEMEDTSNAEITSLRIFGNEVFVEIFSETDIRGVYVVQRDNSYLKLDVNGMAIHQTEVGKILFSDGSIYDPTNQTVRPLDSTILNPVIQSASGNFAIIGSYSSNGNTFQVYDTEAGHRYNVASCNGPRMIALSTAEAIVDDCSGDMLVDMTTGSRTNIGIHSFNGESLYLGGSNGAYITEQVPDGNGDWEWHVNHIDTTGVFTPTITDDVRGSGECMNCFNKNQELFVSDNWIAVKGFDIVTIHDTTTNLTKTILDHLNVLYIDLKGATLTYVGETTQGESVNGTYDLLTDIDSPHHRDVQLGYIESY